LYSLPILPQNPRSLAFSTVSFSHVSGRLAAFTPSYRLTGWSVLHCFFMEQRHVPTDLTNFLVWQVWVSDPVLIIFQEKLSSSQWACSSLQRPGSLNRHEAIPFRKFLRWDYLQESISSSLMGDIPPFGVRVSFLMVFHSCAVGNTVLFLSPTPLSVEATFSPSSTSFSDSAGTGLGSPAFQGDRFFSPLPPGGRKAAWPILFLFFSLPRRGLDT